MLRLLLPEKPLDLPDPRHASDIRALVGFPQHPWELVGLEHQRGKQEVSAATSLALPRGVIPLASSLGQFAFKIETSLSGQLRTHHSSSDVSAVAGARDLTTCGQHITLNLQRHVPKYFRPSEKNSV